MPLEYVTSPLLCEPTRAVGVAIAGPGSAWTSTAYATLIASTASAITLAGVTVRAGTTGVDYEIDIATGGAGSEVVVATFRGTSATATIPKPFLIVPGALYDAIGSGQRVSWRLRVSTTTTANWLVTVQVYGATGLTTVTATTKVLKVWPSAAAGISLITTTVWAYTAWTLLAVTTTAVVIPTLVVAVPLSNFDWEIELGSGIDGAQSLLTTIAGHEKSSDSPAPGRYDLIPLLSGIPADQSLWVRMRKSSTFGTAFRVAAQYYEAPL